MCVCVCVCVCVRVRVQLFGRAVLKVSIIWSINGRPKRKRAPLPVPLIIAPPLARNASTRGSAPYTPTRAHAYV